MAKTRKITPESLQEIMDYYFPDAYRVEIEKNWHQQFIEDVFGKVRNADTIELAAARFAPLLKEYEYLCGPIQIQFSLMQFAFVLFHKKQWKNHHDATLRESLEIFKKYLEFDPLSFLEIE
jgi:hypothetical protein